MTHTIDQHSPCTIEVTRDDNGGCKATLVLPTYEGELKISVQAERTGDGDWVVYLPWPEGIEETAERFTVPVDNGVRLESAPNGLLYIGAPDVERTAEWTHREQP